MFLLGHLKLNTWLTFVAHIVSLLGSIALDPCYPKRCPQTSNLSITWKLLESRIVGSLN